MRVYRDVTENNTTVTKAVFDIMEATYTGEDMGKRMITATIKFATPIDFKIGDYVKIRMQNLIAGSNKHGETSAAGDITSEEKFYIYTEPQCKKTARPMSTDDAFETTVIFYPRQYELSCIQMRDFVQQESSNIIYTGFDNVTFYGGAHELLDRCMACMKQQYYNPSTGAGLWNYDLAPEVDERVNNALESFSFSFKGNSVMDALLKLNDKDGINTTFFINERTIYVGYKRPYLCKVTDMGTVDDTPLYLMYGKTSHERMGLPHGGLYDITKSVSEELPLTKLFAYGASRNLNRYYCSDRIQSGRFVNKLMLPSFSDDGMTDYVLSEDGVSKYGIVEGSRDFEEIYPSLRYMTYADIRGINYCIKVRTSGLESDIWSGDKMEHMNSSSEYPIARVQCYKVVPCTGDKAGRNTLVEAAPPEDLAIFIHATGKTVKVVLCGDDGQQSSTPGMPRSVERQLARDAKVPTTDGVDDWIEGACFCVHDDRFEGGTAEGRDDLFTYDAGSAATSDRESNIHRIEYVDTFWLTDLYVFTGYNQTNFRRDGYSAWAWPRLNAESNTPDSLLVNEVVAVEPIVIPDTSDNINSGRQQHFDIYLRDLGFAIDEQNDFGEMVFVYDTPTISVLDGTLTGREFTIDGGNNMNDFQERVVCAYKDDGSFNDDFMFPGDSGNEGIPAQALAKGAVWRIRLNRNDNDSELSSVGLVIPNTDINMAAGDHIVLLDIYMPDIYIRAAEQRLLREAKKFLEANDKGNVNYAISFDKVRIQQIPNYAYQMREGVRLRMMDDDLNITSDNVMRYLINNDQAVNSLVQLFTDSPNTNTEKPEMRYTYDYKTNYFKANIVSYDESTSKITIKVPMSSSNAQFGGEEVTVSGATKHKGLILNTGGSNTYYHYKEDVACTVVDDHYLLEFVGQESEYYWLKQDCRVVALVNETISITTYTRTYKTSSQYVPAILQDYIDFKANKTYEIRVLADGAFWSTDNQAIKLTPSNSSVDTYYAPSATVSYEQVGDNKLVTYTFKLPESFNDNHGYYVALEYHGDGATDYAQVGMLSVKETDLMSDNKKVNYVDFIASRVTIKILDNSRPMKDDTDTYVNSEYHRERIHQGYQEPIFDIQAQITEETKASSWAQVMNKVEETAIEVDRSQQAYADLVRYSRANYQRIFALKNALFDPDGTCNSVFLQVMMLQVGADSMNYQLRKTRSEMSQAGNGYRVGSNYTVMGRDATVASSYDVFSVVEADLLDHYVYVQGTQNGGTWEIPGSFSKNLTKVDNEWPVYYVALKCSRDGRVGEWVCDTEQHPVNGTTGYWYFNWGILQPDNNGVYSLTETRGNAYMYGDNIIAGKISDMAGKCYFDLTHGNFVLAHGSSTALSYINGVLTISGLDDTTGIGKAIKDLGLEIEALENEEIGGENISFLKNYNSGTIIVEEGAEDTYYAELTYYSNDTNPRTHTLHPAGKYTFSADNVFTDAQDEDVELSLYLVAFNSSGQEVASVQIPSGTYNDKEPSVRNLLITTSAACYFCIKLVADGLSMQGQCQAFAGADNVQLQQGTKSTAYQEYVQHLTEAMKGSTQIAGGLMMSNLLMLKDENGNVVAGMSGLTDDSTEQGSENEGVAMWSGGSYNDALTEAGGGTPSNVPPILLTKTGIGSRIGCMRVASATEVDVISPLGKIRIDTASGGIRILKNNKDKIVIVPDSISSYAPTSKTEQDVSVTNKSSSTGSKIANALLCSFTTTGPSDIKLNQTNMSATRYATQAGSPTDVYGSTAYFKVYMGDTLVKEIAITNAPIYQSDQISLVNQSYTIGENLPAGTYEVYAMHTNGSDDTKSVSIDIASFSCKCVIDPYLEPITVIGDDGIISAKDRDHYFQIVNGANSQDVIMQGLPTSDPSSKGQLYVLSDNIVRISTGIQ